MSRVLNPEHPVCRLVQKKWPEMFVWLMHKAGLSVVRFDLAEMEALQALTEKFALAVNCSEHEQQLIISLIPLEDAEDIAKGGGNLH